LGTVTSVRRDAKRKARAALEAAAGHPLSPRQLKRARKALARLQSRTDVMVTEGGAA